MGPLSSSNKRNSVALDVSEMVPPEPLQAILSALMQLPAEHQLTVHHRRQPFPLYDMLDQTGYHYQAEPLGNHYQIQIWPGDQANPQMLSQLVD